MKFPFIAAILAVLTGSRWGAKAADHHHHGEGDADVDAMVSHHAVSEAVLSNVQEDRRALEGSKSAKQPKRTREKVAKSSKQQPKSSKADTEQSSNAERELCIWGEKQDFTSSVIKKYVEAVIESVNEAKTTLANPTATVLVVVPEGETEKRSDRVLMLSKMAYELGEDESTFTFVEDFDAPTNEDTVAVHLDCGETPKIVVYEDGVQQYEELVLLALGSGKECKTMDDCEIGQECFRDCDTKESDPGTCEVCDDDNMIGCRTY